jgi:hypothetical protein
MKYRKVLTTRCHIGAGIQSKLTFYVKDPTGKEADGEMELWPVGVYVKKNHLLIPFANISSVTLAPEEEVVEEVKRGPGRPPKDAA